ncbi:MAG TPA: TetR family transcriptional regulator [Kofleriaceae bacterium]|nr:TetR family transcriptional regulator [Kofleriaceae bacterium]
MAKPARKAPKTRAEKKQRTRAALIAAGLAEISEHGLEASLDAICARAGLTRGAFYVHFADREAFLIAVMNEVLGRFVASLTHAELGDVRAAIAAFIAAAAARSPAVHDGGALRFHHVTEACLRSRAIGDAYRGIVLAGRDRLAHLIARDHKTAALRARTSSRALADTLVVVALGVAASVELGLELELGRVAGALGAMIAA